MQKLREKILEYSIELSTIYIACSGGVDSMFLAKICLEGLDKKVFAIIVNHNLQTSSKQVAIDTLKVLNSWGINGIILEWTHGNIANGIEEEARNARYSLITEFCKKGICNREINTGRMMTFFNTINCSATFLPYQVV